MGVGEDFETFCRNLTVNNRNTISDRAGAITRRLNLDFRSIYSDSANSRYVGSYGRGTAIRGFSDLDLLYEMPWSEYTRFNGYLYNGQSSLLQAVRNSIRTTYPNTEVGGDGQVVVVQFADGMCFEVVPGFRNNDNSFTYPDSNAGGSWKITNPLPEIAAVEAGDHAWNNNMTRLCRMTRAWRRKWDVSIGGLLIDTLVIDTLAAQFLTAWTHTDKSYFWYDYMTRDFMQYLGSQDTKQSYWRALGSGQYVHRKGIFEYKARQCYNLALQAIQQESNGYTWSARQTWREIYGTTYGS